MQHESTRAKSVSRYASVAADCTLGSRARKRTLRAARLRSLARIDFARFQLATCPFEA
jgi:hypothetical protein